MRCPVCRAELAAGPQCRRCRADLSLLFALETQREQALALAASLAARGCGADVLAVTSHIAHLRDGEDGRRLQALGHVLRQDFARAWDWYRSRWHAAPTGASSGRET